jgi:hypothetical protein
MYLIVWIEKRKRLEAQPISCVSCVFYGLLGRERSFMTSQASPAVRWNEADLVIQSFQQFFL